jgi:hypothetical protein
MNVDSRRGLTRNTYTLVLAGGRGSRLRQLTDHRAKPAVPFAGTMRIIDFTLGNCVNSGLRRIGVLTQYKAQTLIRHVERSWGFLEASLGEFVDIVPAQQQTGERWYSGTANAVFQNLDMLREARSSAHSGCSSISAGSEGTAACGPLDFGAGGRGGFPVNGTFRFHSESVCQFRVVSSKK